MSKAEELDPKEYAPTLTLLKQIDFLNGVPDDRLNGILFSLQKEKYGPKKTILFQGEIANRMFIVRGGAVSITTKNRGSKIHLADLNPVSYFGEISLLTPSSATATATAGDQGADLLILTHDAMSRLAKSLPDIHDRIKQVIQARLDSKNKAKKADSEDETA